MKTTIYRDDFIKAFKDLRPDSFSTAGLHVIYDYPEEYEELSETGIDLDVIAVCCVLTEYDDLEDFHQNYDKADYPTLESIRVNTTVITIPGTDGFIIADF